MSVLVRTAHYDQRFTLDTVQHISLPLSPTLSSHQPNGLHRVANVRPQIDRALSVDVGDLGHSLHEDEYMSPSSMRDGSLK